MAELLTDLLEAGLIENLGGDDERFAKIERAAGALAQEFCSNPPALIRAILAGLDPDIPPDDPAIGMAERVLLVEWKSVRSVFPIPRWVCYGPFCWRLAGWWQARATTPLFFG